MDAYDDSVKHMRKQTIVVNDIAASPGGGLTVLREFYDAVTKRTEDMEWVFLLSKPYIEETENVKVVLLPEIKKHFNRVLFDSLTGWKTIDPYHPSAVFSLQNTVVSHCKGKKVTYVHQPLPFQKVKTYSFLKKEEFRFACIQHLLGKRIIESIKQSDLSIVQTKWMKEAVEELCPKANVKQIYPGFPLIPYRAEYVTTKEFFYPTSDVPYKNNEMLIDAAKKLRNEGLELKTALTVEGEDAGIDFLGRIPSDEVYRRYVRSCLVFPSYIETFGYPLIEARTTGSIILASDCPFSHELLDGYENAYFFDPFDQTELEDQMRKVASGEISRKDTTCAPKAETYMNTWDQVIDEILAVARE